MAVGRQFGGYTLQRKLARGGMAEIFLASRRGEGGEHPCVIKMMLPERLRDAQALKLFLGEARLASLLEHPNIVRILSLDRVDDYFFIAMEYVPGETLIDLLIRSQQIGCRLPPAEAAAILHQACQGMDYAHRLCDAEGKPLRLVHRDISPTNIMLTYDGQVKILDFGIAAARVRTAGFPDGRALGKLAYLSPEQCSGEVVDSRSDIYSLGIVAWELVTGETLFGRLEPPACVAAIVSGNIYPPSRYEPRIPPSLEEVILKALSLRPRDRFASAGEMARALEACFPGALPDKTQLAESMLRLFGAERRKAVLSAQVGEELQLEKLLFDDLEAEPPARPPIAERRQTLISRATRVFLLVTVLLLAAAVAVYFWLTRRAVPSSHQATVAGGTQELAMLQVDSSPRGARIWLDGQFSGRTTPAVIEGLRLGQVLRVRLVLPGYEPWEGQVILETGRRRVAAQLHPKKTERVTEY